MDYTQSMPSTPGPTSYARYLNTMPAIPEIAAKVLFMVEGGRDLSFTDLEKTIGADPSLTAKILKIANSAQYSRPRAVTKLSTAVSILGFNTIRSLVLLVIGSNLFAQDRQKSFFQGFWRQSLGCAFRAKALALTTVPELAEEVFTAGLLHNIGQVALYYADSQAYPKWPGSEDRRVVRLCSLESAAFGVDHRIVGAEVLQFWNFPELLVDVAREHGSDQILSVHKKAVLLVSVAGFLSSNHLLSGPPVPLERIASAASALELPVGPLDDWDHAFVEEMASLPLFRECVSLFLD